MRSEGVPSQFRSCVSEDGLHISLANRGVTAVPEWVQSFAFLTTLDLSGNQLTELPGWLGNLTALTTLDVDSNELVAVPESLGNLAALTTLRLGANQLTSLPDSLGNLIALTTLNLDNNQLTMLPDWLSSLMVVTVLDLAANQLTALPGWLGSLTTLTTLGLGANHLTALPESIGNLTALTTLYLDNNQLTALPESLGNLAALATLRLEGNQLTTLPESLGNLTALTTLDLSGNQLTDIPFWLGNLTALTTLGLRGNQLTALPESLGSLTALTTLGLRGNQLTALPESLGNLTALTALGLGGNQLTALPGWLGSLTALTTLGLGGNQLTALPESLGSLTALTALGLRGNQLTALPESLGSLTALTTLYLESNQLAALPESLGSLTALTALGLVGNQLTALPESLGNLTALTTLYLDNNQLTELPESLGNLTALTALRLDNNQLTELPESLGNLTALTTLGLSGNQLTELPESIGNLTALTTLYLDNNQLTELPESLGNLTALTTLGLGANQLTELPISLKNLTSLLALYLYGNSWRSPLLEISEGGTEAVRTYLTLVSESAAELWMSKLLVVGQGAVGKTSLIKALAGQQYDPDEPTTHGLRIIELKLNHPHKSSLQMSLAAWDFGGQEIYHATHQFFLTDRSLFLLLWNARQGWEQAKLPYWLEIIKARAPYARVILVATHAEGRPVDIPLAELKASYKQIVDSKRVDNSNGDGIEELRRAMADEAIKLPLMGSHWPETWVTGVQAINEYDRQYATPEDLYHRLARARVNDRNHQTYLLRALHLLGDILFFDEDEELNDMIILHPQWVNNYIARILDSPEVAANHGLLTRSHQRRLWSDLDPGMRDRLLRMMEKVDLSYQIPDDPTAASLIVEQLPWEAAPYQEFWEGALQGPEAREIRLRYQLDIFPPGVPTWFIAREHRFSSGIQWRTGALLRYSVDPRVHGLIRAYRQDRAIDLAVRGPVPQEFFSILKDGFESTLSRYKGLQITRMVPCNCGETRNNPFGQPCQHLYQYDLLLYRLERGRPTIECPRSLSTVNVAELLLGIAPTDTDKIMSRLERIEFGIKNYRAETAWAYRDLLKNLRRGQTRAEAVCPSIFTLIPATGKRPRLGTYRLKLRLYCEQPGEFHATPESSYSIEQPKRWLRTIAPYLNVLLAVLKNTSPLLGPVLGMSSDYLAKQLADEVNLMAQLVSALPGSFPADMIPAGDLRHAQQVPHANEPQGSFPADRIPAEELRHIHLDVDYRALYAVLKQVDPSEYWGGLNRIHTPEGELLWLCRDHAQQYSP